MSMMVLASGFYPLLEENSMGFDQTELSSQIESNSSVISFVGESKYYCVCIVDVVNSTWITASLSSKKLCEYYSTFLNSISTIAKEFGAIIVKNVGDSILYYFPHTVDLADRSAFADVIECGLEILRLRSTINQKMSEHSLPPISFRISSDYGPVMIAKMKSSLVEDLFGSTVNMCAKINSKTSPNTMVIGSDMYQIVKSLIYKFQPIGEYSVGLKQSYPIYSVTK
jgi:class 3 adenylate cyclase